MKRFDQIEQEHGRPMADVLKDLYEVYGSGVRVAAALGIDQSTLNRWLMKLGLEQKAVIVPRKELSK